MPSTWRNWTNSTCCLIEQPLAHDDIFDHAKLKPQLKTPLCLDESIVSPEHARWAIEMDACDIINIKPSRIGGYADARRIHDMAQEAGMPVWHGGMLETGIGRGGQRGAGQPAQLHAAGRHQRQ